MLEIAYLLLVYEKVTTLCLIVQHYASRGGHLEVCRLLLSHGSDTNAVTNTGQATPLHRAAYMGHRDVVALLLGHRANPLAVDADGLTPLHKVQDKHSIRSLLNLLFKKKNVAYLTSVNYFLNL